MAISIPNFQYNQPKSIPGIAFSKMVRVTTKRDFPKIENAAGKCPTPNRTAAIIIATYTANSLNVINFSK